MNGELELSQANPDGQFNGQVSIKTSDDAHPFNLNASLSEAVLNGAIPVQTALNIVQPNLTSVELAGTAEVQARVSLSDGFPLEADFSWQADGNELTGRAEGTPNDIRVSLSGAGLSAQFQDGVASIQTENYAPSSFLISPDVFDLTLNGNASYNLSNQQWDGDLQAFLSEPLPLELNLIGEGENVFIDANLGNDALSASISGQALPTLDLSLIAEAPNLYRLSLGAQGELTSPRITGAIDTEALKTTGALDLQIPAQQLNIESLPDSLLDYRITGESLRLELSPERLAGDILFPFVLQGQPHQLNATLSGSPQTPNLTGQLEGSILAGELSIIDLVFASKLQVNSAPWVANIPVPASILNITAQGQSDASWTLQANTSVPNLGDYLSETVTAQLSLTGQGSSYQGDGILSIADASIPVTLSGAGANAVANALISDLDLALLNDLSPIELSGLASANLLVDTNAGLNLRFDAEAAGTVAGQEFSVLANSSGTPTTLLQNLTAQGRAQNVDFALAPTETPQNWLINLYSDTYTLNTTGQFSLADVIALELTGNYQDYPLTLNANYRLESQTANLNAQVSESIVTANYQLTDGLIQAQIATPQGDVSPVGANATLTARFADGALTLLESQLSATFNDQPINAIITGDILPITELDVDLQTTAFNTTTDAQAKIRFVDGVLSLLESNVNSTPQRASLFCKRERQPFP